MTDLSKAPRCAAYLAKLGVNLLDDNMNDYWAALCVAESFSDKALGEFGGINFHTMKGPALLARIEVFLECNASKPKKVAPSKMLSPLEKITAAISGDEIVSKMTPKGAWTQKQLAEWGVPWPPPKGWKDKLTKNWRESRP